MAATRTHSFDITRRGLPLGPAGAAAAAGLGLAPGRPFAQAPISVAGIHTVPVEQHWVSRIHVAAEAAKAAGQIS